LARRFKVSPEGRAQAAAAFQKRKDEVRMALEDTTYFVMEGIRGVIKEREQRLRLRAEAPVRDKPSAGREQELMQLDESLRARERYIAECEQRLADAGQMLSEREAMLEQREQMLVAKERDFFRRSGDLTRQLGEATAAAAARPV
jgi:hypothetical protein